MTLVEIGILFSVMTALALVPSASVLLVVARSSTAGFKHGAVVTAGIVTGDLVFVFLAILGMTVLAEVAGSFFLLLRYLAAAYLIWFGVGILRAKRPSPIDISTRPSANVATSFFSGLILTLGDIKAIFFYASLFPAFIDLTTITTLDIAIIALLTIVAVGGVKLAYAYSASKVAFLSNGFKGQRAIKITAGSFMIGAGTYLMVKT